jgi:hypothetical protein
MDQTEVKNELLFFGIDGEAKLRFKALPSGAKVYCNGTKLGNHQWTFTSGCTKVVITDGYMPSNQYTIYYVPAGECHNINFTTNISVSYSETFAGTDHNTSIKLKHKPYTDYNSINTTDDYDPNTSSYIPVKVTLINTDILGPNKKIHTLIEQYDGTGKRCPQYPTDTLPCPYTKNVTNYLSDMQDNLKPYDAINYPYFEYIQDGDKLIFTETFNKADIRENKNINHGNATVNVEYRYVASVIRVKVIMRRVTYGNFEIITPTVKEYTLRMKIV